MAVVCCRFVCDADGVAIDGQKNNQTVNKLAIHNIVGNNTTLKINAYIYIMHYKKMCH